MWRSGRTRVTFGRRREAVAVCENHENGRQPGRRILDKLLEHGEDTLDLTAPRGTELILDADQKHDAQRSATANCFHDSRRVGGVDRRVLIFTVAHVPKSGRVYKCQTGV